ncbi:hypothetical protein Tco_1237080 [Tanacetum coccineum]
MADASAVSICNLSQPYRRLRLILVRLVRPLLLNGKDDEYERSIFLLGYLFGSVFLTLVDLYMKLLSERKLYRINGILWDARNGCQNVVSEEVQSRRYIRRYDGS